MRYARRLTIPIVVLGVLLAPASGACAAQERPRPGPSKSAATVTVVGTLTDEGVECQALRGDDERLYTLTGKLDGFRTGDRVTVTGTVAEISTCQQGTTIAVKEIRRAGG